ncbi:hypothetical protein [Ruminococcus sp. XPD3002]
MLSGEPIFPAAEAHR